MNLRRINTLLESAKRELREDYGDWRPMAVANLYKRIIIRLPEELRRQVQITGGSAGVEARSHAWRLAWEASDGQESQILTVEVQGRGRAVVPFKPSEEPDGDTIAKVEAELRRLARTR